MFNEAYSSGKVPIHWQIALITPIGDASDPTNYKPIAVEEPLWQLYANILNHTHTHTHTHTSAGRGALCPRGISG